ncbi:unnamed protein product [Musa acuminata subsp. malaccensis]|uniref:(wild Malaysian banana) hypothetical protein n=1 Tax=Musa acuminata subsp. malaccensis TaxID=214687 RepID=A0A804L808_MUSAM|nr:unnamed protein product [Musa acuminata subsp. malaccensis]
MTSFSKSFKFAKINMFTKLTNKVGKFSAQDFCRM